MCAMLLLVGSVAHAASSKVSLCYGKMASTGVSKTGKGRVSAAVVIPKSELLRYAGAKVKAMRVGLVTADGVSNLTAWVRNAVDGTDLCSADISQIASGWNEVALTDGLTINADNNLVLGYSFDQEKSVKCMSVAGADTDGGVWIALRGDDGDAWQNRSGDYVGSLSVELVVEGDNVPTKNVAIVDAKAENKVVKKGDRLSVSCTVRNTEDGDALDAVSYEYSVDGETLGTLAGTKRLAYGEEETVTLTLPTENLSTDAAHDFVVKAVAAGDGYDADNTAAMTLAVYTDSVERKVLLEEFTSEDCPNCPRAIETIKTCESEGYAEHWVQISHHVGYKDDWLTVEEDKAYVWFYGDDGSFAPAGMFDRTQNDAFNASVPVFSIGYANTFRPMVEAAMAVPAFVSVAQNLTYDAATRQMGVAVTAKKMPQLDALCKQPRLTVIVLEDSILHHNQAGYNSTSFCHRHVYRKCISEIWGDVLTWNGSEATANYTFTLPEDWDARYIETVAFISNYNADDRNDCNVFNANRAELKGLTASIGDLTVNRSVKSVEYYDLSGRKVVQPAHGVCLKKVTYADGTHKVSKQMY